MAEDLTGRVFGKWTVLQLDHIKPSRLRYWLCRCECGRERAVFSSNLKNGLSASCGCTIGTSAKQRLTKHGMADSKPHMIWCNMLQRCRNPRNKAFRHYGARGIQVCERWLSFAAFWEDMGPTYQEGLSIERLDNDGNYEISNCIWVQRSDQSKNRRPPSQWEYNNGKNSTSSRVIRSKKSDSK